MISLLKRIRGLDSSKGVGELMELANAREEGPTEMEKRGEGEKTDQGIG